MSDSDSGEEEFLNCYSSLNTKFKFKEQVSFLKRTQDDAGSSKKTKPPKCLLEDAEGAIATTEHLNSVKPCESLAKEVLTTTNATANIADVLSIPEEPVVADNVVPVPEEPVADNVLTVPEEPVAETSRPNCEPDTETIVLSDSPPRQAASPDIILFEEIESPLRRSQRIRKKTSVITGIPYQQPQKSVRKKAKKQCQEIDEAAEETPEDDLNYECNVKIIWKSSSIVKIPVRRFQKLFVVFDHFVKEENVNMDQILLTLHGKTIKPTDTPETLNLDIIDFLEGGVVANTVRVRYESSSTNDSKFVLKFQNSVKEFISLPIKYEDKLKGAMLAYAEQIEKPLGNLKFLFDGSALKYTDTPEILDMESGDVVDVLVIDNKFVKK